MAIYKHVYAEEHFAELFQEAHDSGEVFILRQDGLSCQLVPTAAVVAEEPVLESASVAEPFMGGELLPA